MNILSSQIRELIHKPVFWVAISLLLVSLPSSQYFPAWINLLVAGLLFWRLMIETRQAPLPPKILLFLLGIGIFSGIFMQFSTIAGKTAGSALLIILMTLKLLESRKARDYRIIISLCFFIMATGFLFSQSIPTLLISLFSIPVLLMALMRITQHTAPLNFKQDLAMAGKLSALALPLMLVLFVLFPRIPGPLWQLPADKNTAQTGLSDHMSPANISRLIQSSALAFRVKFDRNIPDPPQRYWRALVLWHFDGTNWTQGGNNQTRSPLMEALGQPVKYTITLEPSHRKWVYALDMPYSVPAGITYNNNFVLRADKTIDNLKQYQLNAYLDYRIGRQISGWEKQAGLQYPPQQNPKTIALAQQWKQQLKMPQKIIQQALLLFNRQDFIYTLQPPMATQKDVVDDFLFNSRKGFCQHYASSFTLLMRAAGIPARVVLGYQGGKFNPLNQTLSVKQSDAHAWTEVWLKNQGWVRIDPTAAVSPERIEQSIEAALARTHSQPLFMRLNNGLLRQLNIYWDFLDNNWKQWVLGYDAKRQQDLLDKYLDKKTSASDLIPYLFISIALLMLIISLFIYKPFRKQHKDPARDLYEKFCKKFEQKGLRREIYMGPDDFARTAIKQYPGQRHDIIYICQLYIKIQYQSSRKADLLKILKKQVKQFKLQ